VKNNDLSTGASSSNTIADGGIQGVDVKNETLTGTQIDEGSLTGVNADQLDGIDSNRFMQGQAVDGGPAPIGEGDGVNLLKVGDIDSG